MKRSELYELVWTSPITKVSKDLELSGVGLAKVCRRHTIPVPPRGYWAKLKAGHALKREPLPNRDVDDEIYIAAKLPVSQPSAPSPAEERLREAVRTAASVDELVAFPRELEKAHALIAATERYCRQLPAIIAKYERTPPQHRWNSNIKQPPRDEHGRFSFHSAEGLDVMASLDAMDWILRFHHGVFGALRTKNVLFRREDRENRGGYRVVGELKGEKIYFSFAQGYSRKRRETAELIKLRKEKSYASEYRYAAVDRMIFKVEGSEYAIQRSWTGSRQQLEGQLGAIVNECLGFFAAQPVARRNREEAAHQARLRQEREAHIRWKASAQREQVDLALKTAAALNSHEEVRRFLEHMKVQIESLGNVTRSRAATWIAVVEGQLRHADPVEALLSTVTDRAWSYGEPAWWPESEGVQSEEEALD